MAGAGCQERLKWAQEAVAALSEDSSVIAKSGQSLWVSDLATEYGFTDIDGKIYVPTWN